MGWRDLPLVDMVIADPDIKVLEQRAGYAVVVCPFDDGTDDHALHVHRATATLPTHLYCLSEKCRDVAPEEFVRRLGLPVSQRQ